MPMKPFFRVLIVACALPCTAWAAPPQERTQLTMDSGRPRTPEQVAVRFEHALLGFRVLPDEQKIEGDATLDFLALSPLQRLVLEFDRQLDIDRIEIDGDALPPSAWRNPDGRLGIDLPRPLVAGDRVRARIVYAGKPRVAERAPWDGGFVWSKTPDGRPWIATSVQGEGCDLFWPCIDHPQGEPLVVEQRVTVPAPLVAAGNGVLLGVDENDGWRTYRWRARSPNTYAIALNIGPYEELRGEYRSRHGNTIPLHFWHLQGRGAQAKELFEEFPLALDFFEQTIGPYPFADEKMGVVETPHLGMEHQTINAYGNNYEKDEYGYDWLLHHEFAHEWFGNQMTNADWDEMWLHEGFGSYMPPLYLQWLRGDMEYHASLLKLRAGIAHRLPLVSGKPQVVEAVYSDETGPGHDIYYKGAWILHTLRGLIGDEAFFASVRRLVYGRDDPVPGNFRPRYASTREFVDIVNDVTGRDYGWFFDVYVYRAALPELLAERDATGLRLRWKAPDDLPFPMPVEVRIGGGDGRVAAVPMDGGQGHVELPAGTHYTLDPHSKLLRDLPHIDAYREDAAARKKAAAEKAGEKK